jgi:hypothetical protein
VLLLHQYFITRILNERYTDVTIDIHQTLAGIVSMLLTYLQTEKIYSFVESFSPMTPSIIMQTKISLDSLYGSPRKNASISPLPATAGQNDSGYNKVLAEIHTAGQKTAS